MHALRQTLRASLAIGSTIALSVAGSSIAAGVVEASPSPVATTPAATSEAPLVFVSDGVRIPDQEQSTEALATIADRDDYGRAFFYTEPERRSMLVVMWTGDIEELASELTALLGEDAAFEIRAVQVSEAELMEISDAVSDLTPELNEQGVLVVSISRDAEASRVDVGIEGSLDVAEEVLAEFGDVVRVFEEDVPTVD
jgi:hypothetical protein